MILAYVPQLRPIMAMTNLKEWRTRLAVTDMAKVLWYQTGYWVMVMDVC